MEMKESSIRVWPNVIVDVYFITFFSLGLTNIALDIFLSYNLECSFDLIEKPSNLINFVIRLSSTVE